MKANLVAVMFAVALSGCLNVSSLIMPVDVAMLPADCANQASIEQYYTELTQIPKSPLISRDQHVQNTAKYKGELWRIRYICNRIG